MQLTRWIFLRFLGVIYFIAFFSLGLQVLGLSGSHGILPVHQFLGLVQNQVGLLRHFFFPTVFWLNDSDLSIQAVWIIGVFFSVLLIFNILPLVSLLVLWAGYLSFFTVCGDFLHFQWDILLLETGFLAIFFAPFHVWPKRGLEEPEVSTLWVWLFRILLFRLMFSSGAAKALSGDLTWRNLTALKYYYETQPIPSWISWYAHHWPGWFQIFSCGVMFFIELVMPFFIFGRRKLQYFTSIVFIGFQLLIIVTGNYCFFNLLTIALCVLLFDDKFFGKSEPTTKKCGWPKWIAWPLAVLILFLSTLQLSERLGIQTPLTRVAMIVSPYCLVNNYGLFAVMTITRPEIIVEGSEDGNHWLPYEFKYKPGDVKRYPPIVAPHQPRLDWQMWFAALGSYRQNPWFILFIKKLLEGSPDVLRLLDKNAFPEKPPRYIRAVLYDYHFTSPEERRQGKGWWTRTPLRLYCPKLSLDTFN